MLKYVFSLLGLNRLISYLKQNYTLFAKYHMYFIMRKHGWKDSILVYTMGKVGSTTVSSSIKNQMKDVFVHDIHWLNQNNLKADQKFHKKLYRKNRKAGIKLNICPDYIAKGFYLNNQISNTTDKPDKEYKVITLTRDPVAKVVSSFFQNMKRYHGYEIDKKLDVLDEKTVAGELTDLFFDEFIQKNGVTFLDSNPLTWFDEEIKYVFGLDVYQSEFPKEKGYEIYENERASVLLIRLEDLNSCFTEATEKFLGEKLRLTESKNTADDKAYAAVYDKFKMRIDFPDGYLDKMYSSKYAKHFYSQNEIVNFKNKWT